MTPLQGAPTTYNKDFQEAWQLMFDSVDTVNDCIRIATGVISTLKINPAKMRAGLSADMLATDLAEYLVRKGMATVCCRFWLKRVTHRSQEDRGAKGYLWDCLRPCVCAAGVPFRETHHLSGAAVKLAEDRSCELSELTPADLKTIHPLFEDDVMEVWDFDASTERRDTEGGTSRRSVLQQIGKLKDYLAEERL